MCAATNFRRLLLATALVSAAGLSLVACGQGSEIASPGPTNPGTPPSPPPGTSPPPPGSGADCPTGFAEGAPAGGLTTCVIPAGAILTDLTLEAIDGVAYRLGGRVDVGVDMGADGAASGGQRATLTIEPGVTVFGSSGSDFIVVNRGSEIIADGSPAAPIVFTSEADLERQAAAAPAVDDGGDAIGEWGGLVILGQAPINSCILPGAAPGTADCENAVEGVELPDALYGGADPNDDSGILNYVQVRFAGNELSTGNELNGITFGGVGANTIVDFLQVHNNSDDGVEFFGGTVNVRHLVLTGNDDDSIDTDLGWRGNIQYAVVAQRAAGGDNIVEASSDSPPGALPRSDATLSNFTFVGGRSSGWRLNTGTIGRYVNGVIDYADDGTNGCIRWETSAGDGAAGFTPGEDPTFNAVLFDCDGGLHTDNSGDVATAAASVAADPDNQVGPSSLAARFFPGANEDAVTPFDVTTLSAFFEPVDYIGAFAPTETETSNWATGWSFALFPEPACPVGTQDSGVEINGRTVCDLSGPITGDVRLTRGNIYRISGRVDVGVDMGADGAAPGGDAGTLTIESGVTLFGASGADFMVVNRGSQIFSNGTASDPVVFTSNADLLNTRPDQDAIGEWGGLVILGRAPINSCILPAATPGTVDCENAVEGVELPDAIYGGADPSDSSGVLRFTQVRYAGNELSTGNELNGVTFAGVGDGTVVENLQVHNNSDDGVEFFGGTVNVRRLVLTGNDDDSIDTDLGWQGNIQHVIVVQRDAGGDNIVEASSDSPPGALPRSNGTLSNFTFVGGRSSGWRLNTGTIGRYVNGVIAYADNGANGCIRWETSAGDGVAGFTPGEDPTFNSVLFGCAGGLHTDNSEDVAAADASVAADSNNQVGPASLTSTFVNGSAEAAVAAFDVTTLSSFFEPVDYIGAVRDASDRWWAGWSCGLEPGSPC